MEKTKIIFLDIDGVINIYDREDNSKYNKDEFGHLFCKKATKHLRSIIEKTGAKLVISSTWRMIGLEKLRDMWKKRDLPGEIIGLTPRFYGINNADYLIDDPDDMRNIKSCSIPRGFEIKKWLDMVKRDPVHKGKIIVDDYVIIDDDSDMLYEQRNNFVKCHNRIGIDSRVEKRCLDIFNYSEPVELKDLKMPNGDIITAEAFNKSADDYYEKLAKKEKKREKYFESKKFNILYDKLIKELKANKCVGDDPYTKPYIFDDVTNDEFCEFFNTVTQCIKSDEALNRDCEFPVKTYLYGDIIFEMMFGQGTAYSCELINNRTE